MKKLLTLIIILGCYAATAFGGTTARNYIVKTTKAPVWMYQDATSRVLGYIDYGTVPGSELDNNDPQWLYVEHGDLKGWTHILAFSHRASEQEDIDLANGAFADYLRTEGVAANVIDSCTTGTPDKAFLEPDWDDDNSCTTYDNYIEPYSARGMEPMFIYVIDRDVECPVNEAYAYHGKAIRYERTSETFSGGQWIACESEQPYGMMLMSGGKGFDMPASAYHLLTEEEYLAYMNKQLKLSHIYGETSLKRYLETHDIAQAKGWSVNFKQYTRKTLTDLWPTLVPVLVLLVIFVLSLATKTNPIVWAYAAIADLVVLCTICWHYISMPSAQFNDLGGLAWIPICIVALVAMAIILIISWKLGTAILATYDVSLHWKSVAIGFAAGIALYIALYMIMTLALGLAKDSPYVIIAGMLCIVGGTLGWTMRDMIRQNTAVALALPAVFILWTIAILLGFVLIAIAFFVIFFITLWMFMSGNMGGSKNMISGLVGSERATCSKCRHYGTVHCPHSNTSGSDDACSSFEQ